MSKNQKVVHSFQGENNPFYGKHHTEESKEKNRIAHLGKTPVSAIKKGEVRGLKTQIKKGQKPWNFNLRGYRQGHLVSESTRFKIGIAQIGEKNHSWKGGLSYLQKQELIAGRKKPNQCELCSMLGEIFFDHSHQTGKFRGWICRRCNFALGQVKDDIQLLKLMINYLETNEES